MVARHIALPVPSPGYGSTTASMRVVDGVPVQVFATGQSARWGLRLTGEYAVDTLQARLVYDQDSAASGNITWDVKVQATAPGGAVTPTSYDVANSVTLTAPGQEGYIGATDVTLAADDGLVASNLLHLEVSLTTALATNIRLRGILLTYDDGTT